MIKLSKDQYCQVLEPLSRVDINHLFARSVLDHKVDGTVYADSHNEPTAYYIVHPYGMSLAFGKSEKFANWSAFWEFLKNELSNRLGDEWIQLYPECLANEFSERFGLDGEDASEAASTESIEKHTRVNFKFDPATFAQATLDKESSHNSECVVRTRKQEYDSLRGTVVPMFFWRDREDFLTNGIGYSLLVDDEVVSAAFSAFIHDKQLEMGIETSPDHLGKGYAFEVCSGLITYCLENGYEPVWSCRYENTGSVKLAQKLGFKVTRLLPYFRMKGQFSE